MEILTKTFCISGASLAILGWMKEESWCGQAQNEVNLDFEVKFDLQVQGRSPLKTIKILTKVFYISIPNLAILAWTVDELSRVKLGDGSNLIPLWIWNWILKCIEDWVCQKSLCVKNE